MRLITTMAVSLMLSGCVGVATVTSADGYYAAPRFALSSEAGSVFEYNDVSLPWPYTKKVVSDKWGAPNSKLLQSDGKEVWVYSKKGLAWRGAVVWVGIPILPMMLPLGDEHVALIFEGDELASAESSEAKWSFCGYAISDESAAFTCE